MLIGSLGRPDLMRGTISAAGLAAMSYRSWNDKLDLVPGAELFQELAHLRRIYGKLGIKPETPVIVHCRTGHQASQTYILLRHVLGYRNVRWFDFSWSGWAARPELPIER